MTKITFILSFLFGIIFFISCKKNNEATSTNGFVGSYRGTVIDSANGNYLSTLNDYSIVINPTNTPGHVTLTNNLIITNSGIISGTTFSIPEVVAAQTAYGKVVERAVGNFGGPNNNTWTVVFYQDNIDNSGAYTSRAKRSCVLVKQ